MTHRFYCWCLSIYLLFEFNHTSDYDAKHCSCQTNYNRLQNEINREKAKNNRWTNKRKKNPNAFHKVINSIKCGNTYSSSTVNCTGSSVNSGGKLAKSLSESKRGRNGGVICFCSSCVFYYFSIPTFVKNRNTHLGLCVF